MSNYMVIQNHIDELCDELRPLLNAEIESGNVIVETWRGNWPYKNCLYIMLKFPFSKYQEPLPKGLRFNNVNDPHYWKAEILCERTNHVLACRF